MQDMIKAPVPGIQIQAQCLIKPRLRSSCLRDHTRISEEVRDKTLVVFPLEDSVVFSTSIHCSYQAILKQPHQYNESMNETKNYYPALGFPE